MTAEPPGRGEAPGVPYDHAVHSASGDFPAETASVGKARRFVRAALQEWGATDVEWTAAQVVSELATNAVLHARSAYRVELAYDGDALTVRVSDASSRGVMPRRFSDVSTTGRGLGLVASLASEWGVDPGAEGKAVWCLLRPAESVDPADGVGTRAGAAVRRLADRATYRGDHEAFAYAA